MANNQDKKLEAKLHNARRSKKSPKLDPLKFDGKIVDLGDMLELTAFDLEYMTVSRRYDTIVDNRKHLTAHFPPFPIEEMTDLNDLIMRAQARDEFNEKAKDMVLIQ